MPAHFLSFAVDDTENLIEFRVCFQHITGAARNPFGIYKRRVPLTESAHKFNAAITQDGDWSNGADSVSTLYLYGAPLLTAKCWAKRAPLTTNRKFMAFCSIPYRLPVFWQQCQLYFKCTWITTYRFQGSALKTEASCGFYLVVMEQLIGNYPIMRYYMVYGTPKIISSATFGEEHTLAYASGRS